MVASEGSSAKNAAAGYPLLRVLLFLYLRVLAVRHHEESSFHRFGRGAAFPPQGILCLIGVRWMTMADPSLYEIDGLHTMPGRIFCPEPRNFPVIGDSFPRGCCPSIFG